MRIALVGVLVMMFGAGLPVTGCSSDDSSSSGSDQAASTSGENAGGDYGAARSSGGGVDASSVLSARFGAIEHFIGSAAMCQHGLFVAVGPG